jgi:diguanylate cyclase (GGDEF)-like protein
MFNVSLSKQVFQFVDRLIVRGQLDYQKILEDSTRAMVSILDLEELLSYIADAIKRAMKVEKVYLFTREAEGVYRLRFGAGAESGGFLGRLLKDRVMDLVKDSTLITEEIHTEALGNVDSLAYDLGSVGVELVIPMFYKGALKGSLVLGKKGDGQPYNRRDIEILESLAGQAAIAMENARLYEEAVTDGLTGIYHHRYFDNRLKEEMERSRRYGHPLSLIMIDLDLFKEINDEHGHQAGDNLLRELARTLQNGARGGDIVARLGGDEFAILLPETSAEVATEVAHRLRGQVEQVRVGDLGLTISLGVASSESVDTDADLVAQADRALYQAKHSGRNRVETSA